MRISVALVGIALLALSAGVAVGTDNAAPVAAAGLDQSVAQNATVYLDGGGSVDSDGSISSYEWVIETPSGVTTTPNCPTCERTRFTPTTPGEYAVTLTVTDDNGATRSDTLYVTVAAYDMPDVDIDGPGSATVDTNRTFTITTAGGQEPVQSVTLSRNGTRVGRWTNGTGRVETTQRFSEPGTYRLRAWVRDDRGYVNSTTTLVTVSAPATNGPGPDDDGEGSHSGTGTGGSADHTCGGDNTREYRVPDGTGPNGTIQWDYRCGHGTDAVVGPNVAGGSTDSNYVYDTNGEDGIQMHAAEYGGTISLTEYQYTHLRNLYGNGNGGVPTSEAVEYYNTYVANSENTETAQGEIPNGNAPPSGGDGSDKSSNLEDQSSGGEPDKSGDPEDDSGSKGESGNGGNGNNGKGGKSGGGWF